jgi:hypothetical protein
MISFGQICESLGQQNSGLLMDSGEETKAMGVIRTGMSLRKEGDSSFWDDFLQLCADSEGLADLLGVRRDVVASWAVKIKDNLDKVQKHDQQVLPKEDEKQEMLPTGKNNAVLMPPKE